MLKKYAAIGFVVGIIIGAILSFFYPPIILQVLSSFSQILPQQNRLWFINRNFIFILLALGMVIGGLICGIIGLLVGKLRQKKV